MVYYKYFGLSNGKPKLIVSDENYNIVQYPTVEQINLTIEEKDRPKMCCICRSTETYDHWFRHRCKNTCCTGYLCRKCYRESGRITKKDIKRKCNKCGKKDSSHWYKDGILDLCNVCYQKYNPNSTNNTIKSMAKCRTKRIIYIDKFDYLDDKELGYIVECIVCYTYGIKNYNDETDNYRSPFDAIHPEYGKLQIKGTTFNTISGQWHLRFRDTEILWKAFDFVIILCMDDNKPWKNVERVYKIPLEECRKSIAIVKNPTDCVGNPITSRYEKYRIDEQPFNSTWYDMKEKGYIIIGRI